MYKYIESYIEQHRPNNFDANSKSASDGWHAGRM